MFDTISATAGTAYQLAADFQAVPGYQITDGKGGNVLTFSGVVSLDFMSDGRVVSVPIEQGSFAAYNKVQRPGLIRAVLAIMGEDDKLLYALQKLEALKTATEKVSFVTPVREFQSYTVEGFSFSQSVEKGHGVLFVDVHFCEVREVQPAYIDKSAITMKGAKNPADVSGQDRGKLQGQNPNAAQGSVLSELSAWWKS